MIVVRHVELYENDPGSVKPSEILTIAELPEEVEQPYRRAIVEVTGTTAGSSDQRFKVQRIQNRWVFWLDAKSDRQGLQWSFASLADAVRTLSNHLNQTQKAWTSRFPPPFLREPDQGKRYPTTHTNLAKEVDWVHRKN